MVEYKQHQLGFTSRWKGPHLDQRILRDLDLASQSICECWVKRRVESSWNEYWQSWEVIQLLVKEKAYWKAKESWEPKCQKKKKKVLKSQGLQKAG